jgi:hypothetical protein
MTLGGHDGIPRRSGHSGHGKLRVDEVIGYGDDTKRLPTNRMGG